MTGVRTPVVVTVLVSACLLALGLAFAPAAIGKVPATAAVKKHTAPTAPSRPTATPATAATRTVHKAAPSPAGTATRTVKDAAAGAVHDATNAVKDAPAGTRNTAGGVVDDVGRRVQQITGTRLPPHQGIPSLPGDANRPGSHQPLGPNELPGFAAGADLGSRDPRLLAGSQPNAGAPPQKDSRTSGTAGRSGAVYALGRGIAAALRTLPGYAAAALPANPHRTSGSATSGSRSPLLPHPAAQPSSASSTAAGIAL